MAADTRATRVGQLFRPRLAGRVGDQEARLATMHDEIVRRLAQSTATTVWGRLRDEQGLDVGLSTFRRYVRKRIGTVTAESTTVRKEPPPPGEIAEVDYGRLGVWVDPRTGRRRVVHAFVMVLAFSRRIFVRPVLACDQRAWVECHRQAFAFFGAVPRQIRLDNLQTGVLKADIYDPQFNRTYREFGDHYGVVIDPCRARKPKDKPQVERSIPYVRDSFWSGREWTGERAMEEGAVLWCRTTADDRPHGLLPGTVGTVFAEHERSAMLPLPTQPFEMSAWAKATVHPDCHVQVSSRFFSVPWRHVSGVVDVRIGERVARIYLDGELVKTHVLEAGRRRYTDDGDYPPDKIAFFQRTPTWCRKEAVKLGEYVAMLVAQLLPDRAPLYLLRQAQGVIHLAETYEPARINAACRLGRRPGLEALLLHLSAPAVPPPRSRSGARRGRGRRAGGGRAPRVRAGARRRGPGRARRAGPRPRRGGGCRTRTWPARGAR